MALIEAFLLLPAERLDDWTDALLAAGAACVSVQDDEGDTPDEVPLYGEPGLAPAQPAWRRNRVSLLFDAHLPLAQVLHGAAAALGAGAPEILGQRPVQECDWVRQTQAQFAPVRIGGLWVVPSWHEPPDAQAVNIRIDPGVAFGTGTHPTTRLCLAWLDSHLKPGTSVLDYGCGSGILAIAAGLLGAAPVVGVDIDAQAVDAARANAQHNGVDARITTPDALAALPGQRFGLVVANILANPIMLLAPTLSARLATPGNLLLSGILERQAADVIAAYRRADPRLQLQVAGSDEGWVALCGQREAA